MKKITFLLFASLLSSFLIVGCGSSSDGDSGDNKGNDNSAPKVDYKTVMVPGSITAISTDIADAKDKPSEPTVTAGCEDKTISSIPGCAK